MIAVIGVISVQNFREVFVFDRKIFGIVDVGKVGRDTEIREVFPDDRLEKAVYRAYLRLLYLFDAVFYFRVFCLGIFTA